MTEYLHDHESVTQRKPYRMHCELVNPEKILKVKEEKTKAENPILVNQKGNKNAK